MANSIVNTAPLILDVGVVLAAAATMGFTARKLGLPSVFGYLLTGLIVSPFTPGFVADSNQLTLLADIGVVLLLFEVGIEIDLKRISKEQKSLLLGAPIQVFVGVVIGTPLFLLLKIPLLGSLLLSLSIAMSSSVVIVNITRSPRRKTDTSTEDAMLGWSVIQDIIGVTLAAILLTVFGTDEKPVYQSIAGLIGFGLLAFASSKVLPIVLRKVRWEKDLFLIYSVSTGLVLAALGTVVFGIPMALAGFVAGLAINQSKDTEEVRKAILPFRDLFAVLFFVVIGSLIQPSRFFESWRFAILILFLMLALKTLPSAIFAKLSRLKVKASHFAIGISQIGEFSFVLGSIAYAEGALTISQYTGTLLAVVVSIVFSTLMVRKI